MKTHELKTWSGMNDQLDLLDRASFAALALTDLAARDPSGIVAVPARELAATARLLTDLVRELSQLGVIAVDRVELGDG